MTVLTKQSEELLERLNEEIEKRVLTPDELSRIRKALGLLESLGILSNMVIKAAAIVAAAGAFIQYWPRSGK
jgi:hypothetical protein